MNDLLRDVVIVKAFVWAALNTRAAADIDEINFMIADRFKAGMYKYWKVNLLNCYAFLLEFGQISFFLPLLCCTLACTLHISTSHIMARGTSPKEENQKLSIQRKLQ